MERERRALQLERVEFREAEGKPARFAGHAVVFKKRTAIGDPKRWGFWEEIAAGAFDRALEEGQDVRLLVNHDPSKLLARTSSSTLELRTDKRGLYTEAELADTSVGRDTVVLLKRGDLSQMSFGFTTRSDRWSTLKDGSELREVLDVDLFDVSIVTFAAYPETDAALRAAGFADIRRQRWEAAKARFTSMAPPGANRKEQA